MCRTKRRMTGGDLMIGMSLSYKKLLSADDDGLKPEILLPKLWAEGVRSVELRAVSPSEPADNVLKVASLLWDYGFSITVHGKCRSVESAANDVFAPLELMLSNMRQKELIVTLHPIKGDNTAMLTALSDHIADNNYPVRIALENNRKMPDNTDGDCLALVLDAVTRADRANVGICFDMGHYAWFTENFTDSPNMIPPKAFLSRVIHTHIHAYEEGTTHFPIYEWREPFAGYINKLAYKYYGIYNIEISPDRFSALMDADEGYICSVRTLKEHYPFYASLYDEMRFNYDRYFANALEVFGKTDGSYGALVAPSAYFFSTNGYRWAMDVSFLYLRRVAEAPSRIKETLGGIDLVLLTHEHSDHLEAATVRELCDTDILWVAPEFIAEKMLSLGVRREKLITVKAGDDISVGPLRIQVLEGKHFRAEDGRGVSSVGYLVSADNAPSIAFPGDVRDYRATEGDTLDADHCFAHVWLTDRALEPEAYIPKSREFAEFMLKRSKKSIFLTHLYVDREEEQMWKTHHALVAADAIHNKSPETAVHIPKYGEVFELSAEGKG